MIYVLNGDLMRSMGKHHVALLSICNLPVRAWVGGAPPWRGTAPARPWCSEGRWTPPRSPGWPPWQRRHRHCPPDHRGRDFGKEERLVGLNPKGEDVVDQMARLLSG